MTPDVNVLVAASRTDHPHYKPALAWLNSAVAACATGGSLLVLPMVAAGFLRLVTHPKVFVRPTPINDALAFLDALLAVPGVDMPELGREWPALCKLCRAGALRGNDIPAAWTAAAVSAAGSELVSFDKGFAALLGNRGFTLLRPDAAA